MFDILLLVFGVFLGYVVGNKMADVSSAEIRALGERIDRLRNSLEWSKDHD